MNLLDWPLFFWPLFILILIYLSIKDIKKKYIETLDLIALLFYVLINTVGLTMEKQFMILGHNVIGSVIAWLLFFLVWVVTKKRGVGDGELYFAPLAFFSIGWMNTIEALYFCFSSASIYCLFGLLTKKLDRKKPIPFIPFLAGGIIFSLFFI